MIDTWILVAQKDKVFPLNFKNDLAERRIPEGISTVINRRGAIDLYVDELGVKVVVPCPVRYGWAGIYYIPNEGQVVDKFKNVT